MTIQLTEQQQRALDSAEAQPPQVVQVVDPRTNAQYVLIPASEYGAIREIVEDEVRQSGIRESAFRTMARRLA